MVERISSGIPRLDELIEGGFPSGSVALVSGGAGTGKTIFCSQFLWQGLQNDENCLFVTLEEAPEEIKSDAAEFGWDFDDYGDDRFQILYVNPFKDSGGFADRIVERIKDIDADRVVIDSTSTMGMYTTEAGKIRERLYNLIRKLRRERVTAVLSSEVPRGDDDRISRFGVEEFVADSVIVLYYMGIGGGIYRNIEIPKIRKTNQDKGSFPMRIGDSGMEIFRNEEDYAAAQD